MSDVREMVARAIGNMVLCDAATCNGMCERPEVHFLSTADAVLAALDAAGLAVVAPSLLSEGFHTAFRKAVDTPQANQIWRLIDDMPEDDWNAVMAFVVDGSKVAP